MPRCGAVENLLPLGAFCPDLFVHLIQCQHQILCTADLLNEISETCNVVICNRLMPYRAAQNITSPSHNHLHSHQQRGPRSENNTTYSSSWGTSRGGMKVGETKAILCQLVNIGGVDLSAKAANVGEAKVVCNNHEKVGALVSHNGCAWALCG